MGSTFMDDVLDCGNFFDQIDDLLDFPPENECMNNILGSSDECKEYPSIWNEDITKDVAANSFFPGCNGSSSSDLSAELSVPYDDDIIQLEWLSTFVEDSFSGGGMTLAKDTATFVNKDTSQNTFHTSSPVSVLESSSCSSNNNSHSNSHSNSNSSFNSGMMVIPVAPNHRTAQRARSKRPRPATFSPRSLSLQLMPASGIAHPVLVPGFSSESENVRVYKHSKTRANEGKKKTKPKIPTLGQKSEPINPNNNNNNNINNIETTPQAAVRKCLHCEITKTPQWRAGPLGPKTLCNACGVRYKSGRLFPEYRPAASPTFVPSVHSNSHKKVVEMRNNIVVDKNPAE